MGDENKYNFVFTFTDNDNVSVSFQIGKRYISRDWLQQSEERMMWNFSPIPQPLY